MTPRAVRPVPPDLPPHAAKRPWGIWIALAVVLFATVAVGVFGGAAISRAIDEQHDARRVEVVVEALPAAYDLAVYVVSERDAAAAGAPEVVMRPVRAQTDLAIEDWTAMAGSIDTDHGEGLESQLGKIQDGLAGLDALRAKAQEQDTMAAALSDYTDLANDLFGLVEQVAPLGDETLGTKIDALGHLGPAWGALGTEQAAMMSLLAETAATTPGASPGPSTGTAKDTDEDLATLTKAEATWRTSIGEFYAATTDRQRRALDRLTKETAADGAVGMPAQKAVTDVLGKGVDSAGLTPVAYATSARELVRGLQQISVDAADEVAADATETRQDASTTALVITVGVVSVLAVFVVVAMILLVLGIVLSRRRA